MYMYISRHHYTARANDYIASKTPLTGPLILYPFSMVADLGNVNNLADKYNSEKWALVPSDPFVDAQKQCVDAELSSIKVNDMSIDATNALYVTPQGHKGSIRISPELRGD